MLTAGAPAALAPEIERILGRALDARPERRYADMSEMVNDLWVAQTALAEDEPPRSVGAVHASGPRRASTSRRHTAVRVAAAVAACGIIAIVVWLTVIGYRASALPRASAPEAASSESVAQPAAAARELPPRREPGAAADADGGAIIDWLLKSRR
jgi:hypothetical protein